MPYNLYVNTFITIDHRIIIYTYTMQCTTVRARPEALLRLQLRGPLPQPVRHRSKDRGVCVGLIRKKRDVIPIIAINHTSHPRDDVKEALGVHRNRTWRSCNTGVALVRCTSWTCTCARATPHPAKDQTLKPTQAMVYGGDWMRTYDGHVAEVLAAGKPVLVYAGMEDFMCNYMVRCLSCFVSGSGHRRPQTPILMFTIHATQGNQAWTDRFRWDGHAAFRRAETVDWAPRLDTVAQDKRGQKQLLRRQGRRAPEAGAVRGQFRSAEGLVVLTLRDAGHLAPMDQPEVTLAMVRCVCRF